jgi:hypothetical protein
MVGKAQIVGVAFGVALDSVLASICNSNVHLSGALNPYASVTHNSMDEVDALPPHTVVSELGDGMTGHVELVRLENGFEVARKCSYRKGRPLLRGYGHMLSTQASRHFPRVYGYYKVKSSGDCVFMEVTGPTLAQLRRASGDMKWPEATIGSIGVQLLQGFERMHEEFEVGHGDANPSNLVVSRYTPSDGHFPTTAMVIDFDFSQSIHTHAQKISDIRQLMVSLRYLYDGDSESFWTVHLTDGRCRSSHKYESCVPGPDPLCRALEYACYLQDEEVIDHKYLHNLLASMLEGDSDGEVIVWPKTLSGVIFSTPEDINRTKTISSTS